MIRKTIEGILAGIMIAIGGTVFVACGADKTVGAIFFSVALLSICYKGYSLFTGKVGFLPLSHTKEDVSALLFGLLGNVIATLVFGVLVAVTFENYHIAAEAIAVSKLSQAWWQTLIRGFFCGVLMYIAVSVYREHKSVVGILFAIPTFILAGFEHSIADMFYLALGYSFTVKSLLFIVLVLVGNSLGAMTMSALRMVGAKKESEKLPESAEMEEKVMQ